MRVDVAGDGQGLGVYVDRLPVVAEAVIAVTQMAQEEALVIAVADLTGDDQDLAVELDRLPVVTEMVIAAP